MAELAELDTGHVLAIRELGTLRLVREQRLENRYFDTGALRCVKVDGERVIVFRGSGPSLERRARLVRITPTQATTIWQGTAWYVSFRERIAYVQVLGSVGTTVVAVGLRTGVTQKLGAVPVHGVYELTPNPAGTRLAGDSYLDGSGDPRLLVIDLTLRPISVRTIPLPTQFGSTRWLRDDRFAYFGGSGKILVFNATLRLTSRLSGWKA